MNVEKRDFVDQHLRRIEAFFAEYARLLAAQGTIVRTYRARGKRRYGPYYRLTVRDDHGVQKSLHLGQDPVLLEHVRKRLAELRGPLKQRRLLARITRELRQQHRIEKQKLDAELLKVGLYRKGNEIRGWSGRPRLAS